MNGHAGFFVLTPLQLEKGGVVLVQRGWALRFSRPHHVACSHRNPGDVVERGRAYCPAAFKVSRDAGAPKGPIRQNLDLERYRAQTRLPLLLWGCCKTGVGSDGLLRDWPPAGVGFRQKNYGYAFVWFGLCALIAILYVWFQIVRRFLPRDPNPVDDQPLGLTVHSHAQPAAGAGLQDSRAPPWVAGRCLPCCWCVLHRLWLPTSPTTSFDRKAGATLAN